MSEIGILNEQGFLKIDSQTSLDNEQNMQQYIRYINSKMGNAKSKDRLPHLYTQLQDLNETVAASAHGAASNDWPAAHSHRNLHEIRH